MNMGGHSLVTSKRYVLHLIFFVSNFYIFSFNDFNFQQRLINAINHLAPYGEHRKYTRHIWANLKKTHKKEKFKKLLWNVTYCTHQANSRRKMKEIKEDIEAAHDEFLIRKLRLFCKALIGTTTKTNVIENNIGKCFNSYIIVYRCQILVTD